MPNTFWMRIARISPITSVLSVVRYQQHERKLAILNKRNKDSYDRVYH